MLKDNEICTSNAYANPSVPGWTSWLVSFVLRPSEPDPEHLPEGRFVLTAAADVVFFLIRGSHFVEAGSRVRSLPSSACLLWYILIARIGTFQICAPWIKQF